MRDCNCVLKTNLAVFFRLFSTYLPHYLNGEIFFHNRADTLRSVVILVAAKLERDVLLKSC
jgi:hypothetical protein